MKREKLIVELPPLSDAGAAAVHEFLYELMCVVDDHYYHQIGRHYVNESAKKMLEEQMAQEDPPF